MAVEPERAGGRRLAGVVLGSIALAVAAGGLAGWIGYSAGGTGGTGDGGEFEDLGRALVALAAAVVVGVPVLVASVVVGVRRTVPTRRRPATVIAILLALVVVPILFSWSAEAGRDAGLEALGVLVALLVLVAAAGAIGVAAGATDARWPVRSALAVAAGLALVTLAVEVRGDEVADQQRAARYERTGAPLALVHGSDLDAAFAGWELVQVDNGYGLDDVGVAYEISDAPYGSHWVSLVFEARPDPDSCTADPCEELGRRPDGQPILRRRIGGLAEVWVDVDGGRWLISGSFEEVEAGSAVALLEALQPVDAAAFVAGIDASVSP